MFSSYVLCYTKIIVITPEEHDKAKLRKTIQKQSPVKLFKSSRPEVFCKKGVLKNFVKLMEKILCRSLFSYAGLSRPAMLSK